MKRKSKNLLIIFIVIISLCFFYFVSAHSGRTDSSGCHTCRTNCRSWGLSQGEYHCHRAKALPQPEPPVKSHRGYPEGYTEPAPEYESPSLKTKLPSSENESSKSNKFVAQASEENSEEFNWLWLIGIAGVIYIFYIIIKKYNGK